MTFLPRLATLAGLGLTITSLPVAAQDGLSSASAITAAISDNTLTGAMEASGPFEEFYSAGGAIHAADYTGEWHLDGNRLCLAYDGNPPRCWGLKIQGNTVLWIAPDGSQEGQSTITQGNPRKF